MYRQQTADPFRATYTVRTTMQKQCFSAANVVLSTLLTCVTLLWCAGGQEEARETRAASFLVRFNKMTK